jgi:hypothetical protein
MGNVTEGGNTTMEQILATLMENLPVISASCLAVIAGADKIFLILIATIGNIRDAWRQTFPKNEDPKESDPR